MVSPDDYEEEEGFFQKHKVKLIVAGIVVASAGTFFVFSPKETPKKKSAKVNMVNIMPPLPPPPPPPPPKERPPEPETAKEEKFTPEEAPKSDPEPVAAEPAPMGTNIQGDGPDSFGLAKGGGGGGMIGGTGRGKGGGGSKFGTYAGQVQSRVADALRNHKKTRSAALNVKVRVWVDPAGRVTRATLAGTSGDTAVDRTIRDEVLTGLQLQTQPPEGMPMPIVMRITATRPN